VTVGWQRRGMPPQAASPADLTALFIVRLRFEAGSSTQMRAEVRMTQDVTAGFDGASTVTDVESAVRLLRAWALAQSPMDPPGG
jgi:hypothetical protein